LLYEKALFPKLKKILIIKKNVIMKAVLLLVVVVMAMSCSGSKEAEVELGNAELIRIDTIYRYSGSLKQLTWKDEKNTRFISVVSMYSPYSLGTRMRMLRNR